MRIFPAVGVAAREMDYRAHRAGLMTPACHGWVYIDLRRNSDEAPIARGVYGSSGYTRDRYRARDDLGLIVDLGKKDLVA